MRDCIEGGDPMVCLLSTYIGIEWNCLTAMVNTALRHVAFTMLLSQWQTVGECRANAVPIQKLFIAIVSSIRENRGKSGTIPARFQELSPLGNACHRIKQSACCSDFYRLLMT